MPYKRVEIVTNERNQTNPTTPGSRRIYSMKGGKKEIGALVAAMLFLQLVLAPTAMARPPKGIKPDVSLIRAIEEGMITGKVICSETCWNFGCTYTKLWGCSCYGGYCRIDE
jgi:hypothetical protein